jgi:hypothetical protein
METGEHQLTLPPSYTSPKVRIYLATLGRRFSEDSVDKGFGAAHQEFKWNLPTASGQSAARQRSIAKNENMKAL